MVEGEELDVAVDDCGAPLVVDTIPPIFPGEQEKKERKNKEREKVSTNLIEAAGASSFSCKVLKALLGSRQYCNS